MSILALIEKFYSLVFLIITISLPIEVSTSPLQSIEVH